MAVRVTGNATRGEPMLKRRSSCRRALFLSPIIPDETGNGLAMRMGLLAEALALVADVHVVVVNVVGGPVVSNAMLKRIGASVDCVDASGDLDPLFSAANRIADERARLELLQRLGTSGLAARLTSAVRSKIGALTQDRDYDVVVIGRAYLAPLVDMFESVRTKVLDLDEADRAAHELHAKTLDEAGNHFDASMYRQEGQLLDAIFGRIGHRFNAVLVSSEREAELLKKDRAGPHFTVVPNVVRLPAELDACDDGHTLGFIGSLGFALNATAITAFCKESWPTIRARDKRRRLIVAGGIVTPVLRELENVEGVELVGELEHVCEFYRNVTVAIAPLKAGGGTRIKLLEASAYRTAWVATPIGAAGIDWPPGAGGWIAQAGSAFANACDDALVDPQARRTRAQAGRQYVKDNFDRHEIGTRISRFFEAL